MAAVEVAVAAFVEVYESSLVLLLVAAEVACYSDMSLLM
jgi:hypothetical protein